MLFACFTTRKEEYLKKLKARIPHEKEVNVDLNGWHGIILGGSWLKTRGDYVYHSPCDVSTLSENSDSSYPLPMIKFRLKKRSIRASRDYLGFHPLYFAEDSSTIFFTSKKSILWKQGYKPKVVQPSQALEIRSPGRIFNSKIRYQPPLLKKTQENISEKIYETLKITISKSIEKLKPKRIAIAFSGGIDSSLIALATSEIIESKLFLITVGTPKSHDIKVARKSFQGLQIDAELLEVNLSKNKVEASLPRIIENIESPSPLQLEIALPFYFLKKKAAEMDIDVVLAGQGADEVFWGYHKFVRAKNTEERLKTEQRMLKNMARRNLSRDFQVFYPIPILFPYLSKKMLSIAARIPPEQKMSNNKRKKPLRITLNQLSYPEISKEHKKALQYGSNAKDILVTIARERGLEGITQLAEEEFKVKFPFSPS